MDAVTDGRPGGRDDRLLAWPAVHAVTGISRTTAWRMQKAGDFPLPVVVSPGRVGWWESELAAWKIARAPRRPAEPRLFEAASGAPAPSRRERVEDGGGQAAPEPEGSKPGSPAGRRSRTSPGQIAFDFGS